MASATVVVGLDVFEDGALGVAPVLEGSIAIELALEGAEEALHDGVVPAVALATHAARDAVSGEQRPVGVGGVLNAAVGVMHQAVAGSAHRDCRFKGSDGALLL